MIGRALARYGRWPLLTAFALANVAIWLPLWITDQAEKERQALAAFEKVQWLAAPIMAPGVELRIEIGTDQFDSFVKEAAAGGGPRFLLEDRTQGAWYTQLWHKGTMIDRSPLISANEATYGPNSSRELRMTFADYTDDETGDMFRQMQPCETYELRAMREFWRNIGGETLVRYAEPIKGEIEMPCRDQP